MQLQNAETMPRVSLSPRASTDIEDILDHGARLFGEAAAEAYLRGLNDVYRLLDDYPFAGQIEEETGLGFRRWHYRNHRLFYQVTDEGVLILRILHYARDLDGMDWGIEEG
jgi:toxin ParE1/3/4